MPTNKITTTVRIEEEDLRVLHEIAAKEVRSVNNLIEFILKMYLQDYQAKQ